MEDPLCNKQVGKLSHCMDLGTPSQQKDGEINDKQRELSISQGGFLESVGVDLGIGMGLTTCCTGFGGCVKPSILNEVLCKRVEQSQHGGPTV